MNERRLLALFFAGGVFCAVGIAFYFFNLTAVSKINTPVLIEIPKGSNMRSVARELKEKKLVRSENAFYFFARLSETRLKAGVYRLSPDMDVPVILAALGKGVSPPYSVVHIPEGYTVKKIAVLFEAESICAADEFIAASLDGALLEEYGIPASSFQGYLFPDTYFLYPDTDGKTLVRKMADIFFERIATIDGFQEKSVPEIFQILTIASIVEREYRIASEAPLIASVFTNRLMHHIGLYSCATIEYIITEINGEPHPDVITYADLEINNPFNTYRWAGLPPGPISNPGMIARRAAANPPETSYFYFRLENTEAGTHHFSKSFDEHLDPDVFYTKLASH